jgi:hypothetical protein
MFKTLARDTVIRSIIESRTKAIITATKMARDKRNKLNDFECEYVTDTISLTLLEKDYVLCDYLDLIRDNHLYLSPSDYISVKQYNNQFNELENVCIWEVFIHDRDPKRTETILEEYTLLQTQNNNFALMLTSNQKQETTRQNMKMKWVNNV